MRRDGPRDGCAGGVPTGGFNAANTQRSHRLADAPSPLWMPFAGGRFYKALVSGA